jgi:peptide/nickel transport system substrate-binding protein
MSDEQRMTSNGGMTVSRVAIGTLLLLVGLLLAACSGGGAPTPLPTPKPILAPTAVPANPQPVPPSTAPATQTTGSPAVPVQTGVPVIPNDPGTGITEVGTTDARSLNPILIADPTSLALSRLFFSGLVAINPKDGGPLPDLAEAWTVSGDGLTYIFTLRKGVKWSDGQDVVADDVTYSYGLYLNRDTNSPRYNTVYAVVESVGTVDDHTVRFKLRAPLADFLTDVAAFGIVPQHVLVNTQPSDLATSDFGTTSKIVGTGPFVMARWLRSERIEADANPTYHLGKVAAAHYTYIVLPTDDAVQDALSTGKADFGLVSPSVQKGLTGTPNLAVQTYDTYDLTYVGLQLDTAKPGAQFFSDPNVRKALMLALDRDAALKNIRGAVGTIADGIEPPISWAYAAVDPKYRQNVDEANRLLDAAGWKRGPDGVRIKDGQVFSFRLYTNSSDPVREAYAAYLRDAWTRVGIDANLITEKWATFVDRITRTHDFDAFIATFQGDVDPDPSTLLSIDAAKTGLNAGRYLNTDIDGMLRQARTLFKPEQQGQRRDIYLTVQQRVMADLPILPLDFSKQAIAISSRVTGMDTSASDLGMRYRAMAYTWGVNPNATPAATAPAATKKP